MSLRKTTILFVVLALVGLIAVLLSTQQITLMPHFDQVEQQIAASNMHQVQAIWENELSDLELISTALAREDKLYARLAGSPSADSGLEIPVMGSLRINFIVVLDGQGQVVDQRMLNPGTGQWAQRIPEEWQTDLLTAVEPLSVPVSGGWSSPNGLALLSVQPVLHADGSGPQVGWLVVGQSLTDTEMNRLSGLVQLQLQTKLLSSPDLPDSFEKAQASLERSESPFLTPLDEITLGGYLRINDLQGKPVALLEAKLPRFVYRSGLIVKNFQSIALVLSAVIFGATILFVLEGLVLSRVMRLNEEVNQIGQTGDLSARVTVGMKDEIASLSRNINQMLENLEQAQIKRAELFEEVRTAQQNLQRVSRQLVEVQEAERRRLALELHDEIGQILTGLKLMLEGGSSQPDDLMRERMRRSLELVNELIGRVRTMSLELRPAMLDDLGLLPALVWLFDRYTNQTEIQVNFQHSGLQGERFPQDLETAAYRAVQEALTNVARHSGAHEVFVRAWHHEGTLGVQLEDHGTGFNTEETLQSANSTGLIGIRERVSLLDGDFALESAPGKGTCLTVTFPLPQPLEEPDEHHDSAGG